MKIENRTIGNILSDTGQVFAPPDRITVSDACEKYFHLPDGGRYDTSVTPYMVEPMNKLTDRNTSTVVYVSPARAGKTLGLVTGGAVYTITSNPSDVLIVHMTEESARKYSRLTIARMINNSPRLKELLSPSKDDDNILSKFFRNSAALILGHPSPTVLSGTDYKFVFLSDYDRMGDNADGDVAKQGSKRTQTFMSAGCTVIESSPSRDFVSSSWEQKSKHAAPPVGGILGLYNDGDRHIQYWTCPHCGGEIMLYPGLELFCLPEQKQLIAEIEEKGALVTARKYNTIYCNNDGCGAQIDESHKINMNLTGRWIPESDRANKVASYWGSGYSAAFQTWESLLAEEFKALIHFVKTGEEEKLKTTRNVDQGIPYIPISVRNKVTAEMIQDKAENFPQGEVMPDIRFLEASIDVQVYKFVVQVEGVTDTEERWLIDRFDITISERPEVEGSDTMSLLNPASYDEDWLLLIDQVITRRYPLFGDEKERDMGIIQTVCDSGGAEGVTEKAYKFWKECKKLGLHTRFDVVKGVRPKINANTPLVHKTILDKTSKSARKAKVVGEQPLWIINTTLFKDSVMAGIKRETRGAGFYHFGDWLDSSFYAELVNETRKEDGWYQNRGNNEALDLCTYGRAATKIKLLKVKSKGINWDNPPAWAAPWDTNSEVSHPKDREAKKVDAQEQRPAQRRVRMRSSHKNL